MANGKLFFMWLAVLPALAVSGCQGKTRLTYVDLVERLTDLEQVAVLPEKGERCMQWSSYDRRSRYDAKTDSYVKWEANGDGNGWIRREHGKLVIAEMDGPGCIWRIWSATASEGHVTIYLDGQKKPAVDLPFSGYFNGTNEPFTRPTLVHTVANGKNSYIPIPFQKSCKILADPAYGQYYQFTYTVFPKGTIVPTFKRELSDEEKAALDKADEHLNKCGPRFASYKKQKTESVQVNIGPGEKIPVFEASGPAAITSLIVRGALPYEVEQQRRVLRELALAIYWDGESQPSVWCPLGDFFGTAPGANKYRSLTLGVIDNSGYSNWFMPFDKSVRIELINDGQSDATAEFDITTAPLQRPVSKYGRFHAKWHRDMFLPKDKDRLIDWTILKTKGPGRFCGVELEIWNPRGGWWGEGDEKFFIDGEKFPSTFGTGSEDYFGYAWSSAELFQNCFHNQTISEGGTGHISDNRWQIADNVPFQRSFEGYIEKYWSNDRPTQYACVAYWYQAAGEEDPYGPVPPEQRVAFYKELSYPLDFGGILVLEEPAGSLQMQGMNGFPASSWANDDQLWWTGKPGEKLKLAVKVNKDGEYEIRTRLTKASDYGIVQFYIDDTKLGEPIDLFNKDKVIATREFNLGTVHLTAGDHVLTVEMVGANPEAVKMYMFGMDYLKIRHHGL